MLSFLVFAIHAQDCHCTNHIQITGSGQGIGAETARLFANEGAKVIVCDVDASRSDKVAQEINDASPNRALSVPGDVTDPAYFPILVQKAAQFGNGKIHILVNNAGYTWDGVIHKITDKQWDTILAVHNTAPFRLVREASKYFRVKDGDRRCIINISSTSGTHGNAGQANYSLAKAGVLGLTKTIAKEWGPQVCFAPFFGTYDLNIGTDSRNSLASVQTRLLTATSIRG